VIIFNLLIEVPEIGDDWNDQFSTIIEFHSKDSISFSDFHGDSGIVQTLPDLKPVTFTCNANEEGVQLSNGIGLFPDNLLTISKESQTALKVHSLDIENWANQTSLDVFVESCFLDGMDKRLRILNLLEIGFVLSIFVLFNSLESVLIRNLLWKISVSCMVKLCLQQSLVCFQT